MLVLVNYWTWELFWWLTNRQTLLITFNQVGYTPPLMINPDDHFSLLFWSNVKSARIYNFQHEFEFFAHWTTTTTRRRRKKPVLTNISPLREIFNNVFLSFIPFYSQSSIHKYVIVIRRHKISSSCRYWS